MINPQNIVVAVDLSKTDKTVLRYTEYLSSKLNIKKIDLVHVIPSVLFPGNGGVDILQKFKLDLNLKEKIEEKILENSQAIFQNGINAQVQVVEGSPYKTFINTANQLDAGLVVVGRKSKSENSGITAQRIARNFSGNVLLIPEDSLSVIQKIVVPIDFSDNSARALQMALNLSKQIKFSSVSCIHVVKSLPEDYHMDLNTRSEIDARFRENAEAEWERFTKENEWDTDSIPIHYAQGYHTNISGHLESIMEDQDADLIVIGAKGHGAFENFIYGSVTERVVNAFDETPILVVR